MSSMGFAGARAVSADGQISEQAVKRIVIAVIVLTLVVVVVTLIVVVLIVVVVLIAAAATVGFALIVVVVVIIALIVLVFVLILVIADKIVVLVIRDHGVCETRQSLCQFVVDNGHLALPQLRRINTLMFLRKETMPD